MTTILSSEGRYWTLAFSITSYDNGDFVDMRVLMVLPISKSGTHRNWSTVEEKESKVLR